MSLFSATDKHLKTAIDGILAMSAETPAGHQVMSASLPTCETDIMTVMTTISGSDREE
ncbi:MAG: hypothetical protein P8Z78_13900 [Gammaproteobacteria bacterium]